jgi:hypothetical protein
MTNLVQNAIIFKPVSAMVSVSCKAPRLSQEPVSTIPEAGFFMVRNG